MTKINITQIISLIIILISFSVVVYMTTKSLKENCEENEVFDSKLNTCRQTCNNGYNWSYTEKDCVKCEKGSVWNNTKGMCDGACGANGIWNSNAKQCGCTNKHSGPKCQMNCENGSVIIDNMTNCVCKDGYVNNGKTCLKNCKPGWQRNPPDNPECNEIICKFRGKGGPEEGKTATNYCSNKDCTTDGKPNTNAINTVPAYTLDDKGRCVRVPPKADGNNKKYCHYKYKFPGGTCRKNADAYIQDAGFGWQPGCHFNVFQCDGGGRDVYESGTSSKPREQVDPWTGIKGQYVGGGIKGSNTCHGNDCFPGGTVPLLKFFPNNPVLVQKEFNNPKYGCDKANPKNCQAPWVKATIISTNTNNLSYTIKDGKQNISDFPEQFIKDDKSLWFGGPPPEKPPVPYNRCSPGTSDDNCKKLI